MLVIRIMLERIKALNSDEYNHCRGAIAVIAKFEVAPCSASEKETGILDAFTRIQSGKASRLTHGGNVGTQREILVDFLKTDPTPRTRGTRPRRAAGLQIDGTRS